MLNDPSKFIPPPSDDAVKESFESRNERLSEFGDFLNSGAPAAEKDDIGFVEVKDRYDVGRLLGEGGSKRVYEAHDRLTRRDVAVARPKTTDHPDVIQKFLHEARITAALLHPNIMPVYDLQLGEDPYFTMRLGRGFTLANLIDEGSRSLDDHLAVFLKACDAVAHAHSQGIVHLDLKPENIQVGDFGDVLVCDWETACAIDDAPFRDLQLVSGTLGFIAPEQTELRTGVVDERTDIYALSAILYTILCGSPPLGGAPLSEMVLDIRTSNFPRPSENVLKEDIPPALEAVAMKGLAANAESRYQTVEDLKVEIERFRGGFATLAEDAGFGQQLQLLIDRNRGICASIAITLVVFGISTVVFVREIRQREIAAVLAKEEAVVARNVAAEKQIEAELARQAAEDALAQAAHDRKAKLRVGGMVGDWLTRKAQTTWKSRDFNEAKRQAEIAVDIAPDNQAAWYEKGFIHFLDQEFKAAKAAFLRAEIKRSSDLLQLAETYGALKVDDKRLTSAQFASLLSDLPGDRRSLGYKLLLNSLARSTPMRDHMPAVKVLLLRDNRKAESLDVSWEIDANAPQSLSLLQIKSASTTMIDPTALSGLTATRLQIIGETNWEIGKSRAKLTVQELDLREANGFFGSAAQYMQDVEVVRLPASANKQSIQDLHPHAEIMLSVPEK